MKKIKSLMTLLLAMVMILALAACGGSDSSGEQGSGSSDSDEINESSDSSGAEEAKEYVDTVYIGEYGGAAFIKPTFDPTGLTGSICDNGCCYMVYDMLFYVTAEGSYDSRVVESYEWTDDTHMVINIKDGVYFSNGDQLTAEDVLYSLEQRAASSMRSTYYEVFLTDESTISDDGLTLTLVTDSATANYMSGLDFAILDKEYIESIGWDNIDWSDPDQIIGSGPYAVTYFVADSEIHFDKRDDYWGLDKGYDDTVLEYVVYNYTDRSTMCIDFETGVIDLAIDLNESDYARLVEEGSDDYTPALIHSNVVITSTWDVVNNEYLSNPVIREALCHAIDIDEITIAMNGSYGGVATGMLAEKEIGFVEGYVYDYDPDYAKELLESEGISDGEINLTVLCYGNYETIATAMQANLNEIGVNLDVQVVDVASYWGNIGTAGQSDIMLYGYSTTNPSCDPSTHLSYWKSDSAFAVMRRDYDDLLVAAESTLDMSEREELYGELQERWYENFDTVPICEYLASFVYSNSVFESIELAGTTCPWLFDAVYK